MGFQPITISLGRNSAVQLRHEGEFALPNNSAYRANRAYVEVWEYDSQFTECRSVVLAIVTIPPIKKHLLKDLNPQRWVWKPEWCAISPKRYVPRKLKRGFLYAKNRIQTDNHLLNTNALSLSYLCGVSLLVTSAFCAGSRDQTGSIPAWKAGAPSFMRYPRWWQGLDFTSNLQIYDIWRWNSVFHYICMRKLTWVFV